MAKADRKKAVEGSVRPGWFAPVAVLLLLAGVGGGFMGYDALQKVSPNTVVGWGGIGALVVAVVLTALLAASTKRELRIDLKGIKMQVGLGKPVTIEWSEPHEYYYLAFTGSSTPSVEKASVRTADGRRIDVDDLTLPEHPKASLPALVEQYSTAANLPKIKERLDDGDEVEFGAVRMDAEQIHVGDRSLPLENGVVLQIDKDRLKIGSEGKWYSSEVSVRDVANYPCLLRVVGQITQALAPA